MNPEYLERALKVVSNPPRLVNIISRRVRQLNSGQRPLVEVPPRTDPLNIALLEVAEEKLTVLTQGAALEPETPEEAEATG